MKIAIISDIHDNLANLEKFLNWARKNKIEELIVCGDLCAPATLTKTLAPGFKGRIHLVYGNVCDRSVEMEKAKNFSHLIHYGDKGEFEIDGRKVALVHKPDKAKELAKSNKYDIVFYGHTHQPWIETINHTQLINPGTLAGMFSKATFAVWDTDNNKLELKILEKI
ncbi:YfcE family phosphodiesterase [Candidatus Shapirobacteria bacterium]|nr:MAG: YfcE family phosphodiesterase [Candidatus Shapirobacteria bacterium]